MAPAPTPGQMVRVRSRRYLVDGVVSPPNDGDQTLVRMSCLDDDNQGVALEVLWEKELDAKILDASLWKDVAKRGFDPPDLFAAYMHTLRWNCVTSTDEKLFQAPWRAGIHVEAYQLEPLRKALRLPRVNLFIADDVGLGKTIEAGLILRELIMRQKVRRVVIAAPPSIVPQWKDEMETRFGLTFQVLDRNYFAECRRERGYAVNPWNTNTRFIVSHALLRDETYAGPLRDWLGDFAPGSLFILDEAHNAAPASGSKYSIDSQFTRAIRDVAHRFEHRLFLSATPHNGHSNSFAALLEILDPQRFCRGVKVTKPSILRDVMVRRLKDDLRKAGGDFKKREVVQVDIDNLPIDAPEIRLSELLDEYAELRRKQLGSSSKSAQAAAGLVVTNLQKRLLSSIEAFWFTLNVHKRAVEKRHEKKGGPGESTKAGRFDLLKSSPSADDDRAELAEDEVQEEERTQVEAATLESSSGPDLDGRALDLLDQMAEIASAARALPDRRIEWIVDWVRENLCPQIPRVGERRALSGEPVWADKRLIIFTEYADTKRYLEQRLREAIHAVDQNAERIAVFHGGMGEESREAVKRAFNSDPRKHPLRILIATDAAREGVNLQNHCADLVHFDVPWNPSRMEQRNGRIDRKLQKADVVHCTYFVFQQRKEDRVLETLVRKTKTIAEELGSLSPVLERRLAREIEDGIPHRRVDEIRRTIEKQEADPGQREMVEEELETSRDREKELLKQLDTLRDMLEKAQAYLGLTKENFRNTLSSALGLMGVEPLKPLAVGEGAPSYLFPALDRRAGADSKWAEVLDSLREPLREGEKWWELREKPLRPIVFEDPQSLDDEVVHLHLEHRVVQRLLNRFLAQGFVYDDLSRACVGHTNDAIPRVVILGRLSLYGPHAARLHDEIIPVTARWFDRRANGGALKPYGSDAESKTIDLLESALGGPARREVPGATRENLLASVDRDMSDLLPHLFERGAEVAEKAIQKLTTRGEKEAQEMVAILESQQKQIEKTRAGVESQQMSIEFRDWNKMEAEQLKADVRHWDRRLSDLRDELVGEPARIRESYVVKARRIDPVGVVYLWPVSG